MNLRALFKSTGSERGQNMTETLVLLPLYLLLIFGLLQAGQLATGLLVANYAASAIARQAVQDGSTSKQGAYEQRFQKMLTAGMKGAEVNVVADNGGMLTNVTVHACAQIDAFPFVGQFLSPVLHTQYAGNGCSDGGRSIGPFMFNGAAPYRFTVHGKATARMNYKA